MKTRRFASKTLIHTVLVLMLLQLTFPSIFVATLEVAEDHLFTREDSIHKSGSYSQMGVSLLNLIENENEEEEKDRFQDVDYIDLNLLRTERYVFSKSTVSYSRLSSHLRQPALIVLHCTFRI